MSTISEVLEESVAISQAATLIEHTQNSLCCARCACHGRSGKNFNRLEFKSTNQYDVYQCDDCGFVSKVAYHMSFVVVHSDYIWEGSDGY